jgi:hypothetical protein
MNVEIGIEAGNSGNICFKFSELTREKEHVIPGGEGGD